MLATKGSLVVTLQLDWCYPPADPCAKTIAELVETPHNAAVAATSTQRTLYVALKRPRVHHTAIFVYFLSFTHSHTRSHTRSSLSLSLSLSLPLSLSVSGSLSLLRQMAPCRSSPSQNVSCHAFELAPNVRGAIGESSASWLVPRATLSVVLAAFAVVLSIA
eukprot:TRINITY_DN2167_c0_g1_i1.p2 TRINITY_DN2167_c0_g1~~TRINITY_DN2167_c0_g1_i1.p2  ORF type:complete len:162 (+),score=17.44 TRINITY_DN2167_c0_g1_i1:477-962(+)